MMAIKKDNYVGRLNQYGLQSIIETGYLPSSISMNNGEQFVNQITVEMGANLYVMAKQYRTVWIDERAVNANWFPFGSNVNKANFFWFTEAGMHYPIINGVISDNQPNIDQSILIVQNNDGVTHDFFIDARIRYVFNQGAIGTPL